MPVFPFLVAFGGNRISISLDSNENNVSIFDKANAIGDPTLPYTVCKVTLGNGVIIGSSSTANAAMESGSGWGVGSSITVIVSSGNSARIQGAGGDGGDGNWNTNGADAFVNGTGGGGSGTVGGSSYGNGQSGTTTSGGAGATQWTLWTSGRNLGSAEDGDPGGNALEATDGAPDITLAPESEATLEVWGGGGGGGGAQGGVQSLNDGGAGGNPGSPGSAGQGSGAGSGGDNGKAYYEPGSASIIEAGTGTIDNLGI